MYTIAVASNGQGIVGGGAGGLFAALVPFVLIFVIFYFLLILPQRKKEKEHLAMVGNLKKGDKVVTTGGIYGTITKLKKNYVEIEVCDNTKLRVQRKCISQLRGKE